MKKSTIIIILLIATALYLYGANQAFKCYDNAEQTSQKVECLK